MRKLVIAFIAALLILLCSCELSMKAPEAGKVHIIVYGNDYSYDPDHRLYATVNDAVQVGRALSHLCDKARLPYDATFIYGLDHSLDETIDTPHTIVEDVTNNSLIAELENVRLTAEPGDLTFIYFSGHGSSIYKGKTVKYGTDTASGSYFWTRDSSNLSNNSPIEVSQLISLIEAIPGAKVVIHCATHIKGSGRLIPSESFEKRFGKMPVVSALMRFLVVPGGTQIECR